MTSKKSYNQRTLLPLFSQVDFIFAELKGSTCRCYSTCQLVSYQTFLAAAVPEVTVVLQTPGTLKVGDSVSLECRVEGSSAGVKLGWYKNGALLADRASDGVLTFKADESDREAVYKCKAKKDGNSATDYIALELAPAPTGESISFSFLCSLHS